MSHPEDDQLLDVALARGAAAGGDGPVPEGVLRHVAGCSACTSEVAGLRRVLVAGRDGAPDVPTSTPGPAVWQAIQRELGRPGTAVTEPAADPADPTESPGTERPGIAQHHRQRTTLLAVAAALVVGLVSGAGIVLGLQDGQPRDGDTARGTAEQIAVATLEPLPGNVRTGTAEVRGTTQDRRLTVSLDDEQSGTEDGGYLEVWLLDDTAQRLVPVGVLTAGRGEFTVPPGVDLAAYPVVDVSVEPVDGDPAHSGDSVVRGRLDVWPKTCNKRRLSDDV